MSRSNPTTSSKSYRGAIGLVLLAGAFTVLWTALIVIFPDIQATGIRSVVTRVIIHTIILTGLWLGLARTDLDAGTRTKVWLAIAVPFTAWLGVVWWLAIDGVFRPSPGGGVPSLPIAIFLPVLLGLPLLLSSKRVASILDATPASWLIGLQVYRVFGGIFLLLSSRGGLSAIFALPAGVGDVLVGLLALPVAYLVHAKARYAARLGIAWNVLGLVDFAIAIGLGVLTTQQIIVPDRPNTQLGVFPTVMIPTFAVPSSILLHVLSLWQLQRIARKGSCKPSIGREAANQGG